MTFRDRLSEGFARVSDMIRRVFPRDTSDPLRWVSLYLGNEDEFEVFQGIGLAARPSADESVEGVSVGVNARDHQVIVATRNADTLRRVVDSLGLSADETSLFNGRVAVHLSDKVKVQGLSGAPAPLAKKSDADALNARIDALEAYITTHVHPVQVNTGTGTGTASAPAVPPSTAASVIGTTVLEGE